MNTNSNNEIKNSINKNNQFANKKLVDLKTAAQILGLKYSKARTLIYNDKTIGYFDFDGKKMWLEEDIINLKAKHYVKPRVA